MFNIKLDLSNSKGVQMNNQEIPFFDEISLISFICDFLYEEQVKFIVSDHYCSNYGMDCKFDLPCLLEVYDEIIFCLLNRQDFSVEFYEQGREYFISFVISNDNVKLNIRYGIDDTDSKEEELTYSYIKNMFIDFFGTLFSYLNKHLINIEKNSVFNDWTIKLKELELQ